ncbi:MAG TPA: CBS domain-containing protein [Sandaracinaceae bacterium LLY-WYZ-13_1]|nr:CBS domain-containing protein [Sandaracinaceae bacterium LLY-WYZ-13_1]
MPNFESPVTDYMVSPVEEVTGDEKLEDAYRRMQAIGCSALPVVAGDGRLESVISRTDLLRAGRVRMGGAVRDRSLRLTDAHVREHMTEGVETIAADTSLQDAARTMAKKHFHRLYVAEGGEARGVVGTQEVMRAVVDVRANRPVGDLARGKLIVVQADDPLSVAVDRLAATHLSGLVVVDQGWPVGVFRQEDALAARDADPSAAVEEWMSTSFLCMPGSVPSHRAAAQAFGTGTRRVILAEGGDIQGIVTGLDFCRLAAGKA